jgi:hypothetical protein
MQDPETPDRLQPLDPEQSILSIDPATASDKVKLLLREAKDVFYDDSAVDKETALDILAHKIQSARTGDLFEQACEEKERAQALKDQSSQQK